MKTLLLVGLTALVLFALSATASWFLLRSKTPATETSAASEKGEMGKTLPSGASATQNPSGPVQKTAVKSPYTPGADEAVQLANNLRERLAGVREKEAELVARQKQMEIIRQDIRGERAAIDELRKQVNDELKAAEERLSAAERKYTELDEKKEKMSSKFKEMESQILKIQEGETANVQKEAEMIDTMDAGAAAKMLQQLSDTGKMETAVKLLGMMKPRQAAKVLAEMSDPALAAQFLERLKDLKSTPKAAKQPPPA